LNLGKKNTKGGILLAVYYAGHGFHMNGTTHCLFNEETANNKNPYPLERHLRTLSTLSEGNIYVLGIFDCCRVYSEFEKGRNAEGY
jgi:hypothetical protein